MNKRRESPKAIIARIMAEGKIRRQAERMEEMIAIRDRMIREASNLRIKLGETRKRKKETQAELEILEGQEKSIEARIESMEQALRKNKGN